MLRVTATSHSLPLALFSLWRIQKRVDRALGIWTFKEVFQSLLDCDIVMLVQLSRDINCFGR